MRCRPVVRQSEIIKVPEADLRESQERRARRLFYEMAYDVGREGAKHLKEMVPAAPAALPMSADTA